MSVHPPRFQLGDLVEHLYLPQSLGLVVALELGRRHGPADGDLSETWPSYQVYWSVLPWPSLPPEENNANWFKEYHLAAHKDRLAYE